MAKLHNMIQSISEEDWLDIIEDIADQKAILLIGPEVIQVEGQPINRFMRDRLHQCNQDDIAFYYERDGFFLFNSPEGKVRVARQVKRIYHEITPNDAILRRIVEVPFHLIVSVNPDTFVSEAFYRYGVRHRFHFLQHRNRDNENDEIEKPTRSMPLVYNLFGSKDQDDSLVLDYDDVFKLLQSALGSSGLPSKLLRCFREASTYIFLGFEFDKWHSQLLLKFLSDNGRREKMISIDNPMKDHDTHQFVIRQFRVRFLGNQSDFFEELYQRCQKAEMLRSIIPEGANPRQIDIYQRVALGELDRALDLLMHIARASNWVDQVVLLKARYSKLEREQDKIDSRDYRTSMLQIIDTILEIAKNVES